MKDKKITILGAGITGLATAFWLEKEGFRVTILENNSLPGGAMITETFGKYLIDFGPNSGLETTPIIKEIVNSVGLSKEMIYANPEANTRYILKNNKMLPLPTSPDKFLSSKLFSTSAKLRLLKEPFIGKSEDGYYQSIAQFVERRLGKEFLEYAIDPFVSGVFAGNPHKLSVKSAFPKLYRLEELYGGLIKGMIKGAKERKKRKQKGEDSKHNAKLFSFLSGMQSFPKAIANYLESNIFYDCDIQDLKITNGKPTVRFYKNGQYNSIESDVLLSTIPAHILKNYTQNFNKELKNHLNDIFYPPVMVLFVGYERKNIKQNLDGFGFLIPSKEKKNLLGAIWSSVIFPKRAQEENAAFTIFIGGARHPNFSRDEVNSRIAKALNEFHEIMGITTQPDILKYKYWEKSIPQYNLGHIEHDNYFDKFEKENPGMFLSGNYIGGISVSDCIKSSYKNYEKIKEYLR